MDDYYFDDLSGYGQDYANADDLYGSIDPSSFYQSSDYSTIPAFTTSSGPNYSDDFANATELYGAQPAGFYQEPSMFGSAMDFLGSKQGQGLLSLGLGGLSLYGNYLANQQKADQAKAATQLQQRDQRLASANDFAKMHALAQIIQARQGINLDPSLAYAQAVRNEMGFSPKNATDFAGIDVGGPMKTSGLSSQARLSALNNALGYSSTSANFAQGGLSQCSCGMNQGGALGYVRGGSGGQDDKIQAHVSDGEYVMDADVVSALGDGNTEAGAAKLDAMREHVRSHKRSAPSDKIPPKAKDPMKYLKG